MMVHCCVLFCLVYAILRFCFFFFFFNDPATTEIYTLSLHDALPICWQRRWFLRRPLAEGSSPLRRRLERSRPGSAAQIGRAQSELQSQSNLVCRLLLEKKKTKNTISTIHTNSQSPTTTARTSTLLTR